jgi:hypothetical protein
VVSCAFSLWVSYRQTQLVAVAPATVTPAPSQVLPTRLALDEVLQEPTVSTGALGIRGGREGEGDCTSPLARLLPRLRAVGKLCSLLRRLLYVAPGWPAARRGGSGTL